jgi:hypothetical protein
MECLLSAHGLVSTAHCNRLEGCHERNENCVFDHVRVALHRQRNSRGTHAVRNRSDAASMAAVLLGSPSLFNVSQVVCNVVRESTAAYGCRPRRTTILSGLQGGRMAARPPVTSV